MKKETDKNLKETSPSVVETTEDIDPLDDLFIEPWEKLMEILMKERGLVKLLSKKGIEVDCTCTLTSYHGEQKFSFDICATNRHEVVLTDVTTDLTVECVDYFIKKLKSSVHLISSFKGKKTYGAMAFLEADQPAPAYAEKQGFFVIKVTGNSARIINKENFKPKAF